jgi:O-acetyl-ADP-ribose deacetylase (regulator of RNase III)
MYKEIEGDLIKLAQEGRFDVIAHGCNCMCNMGAGIAPQMARAFEADRFPMELVEYLDDDGVSYGVSTGNKGNINKLGCIDYRWITRYSKEEHFPIGKLVVVNAYTQYNYGRNHIDGVSKPVDYDAITLCMRKINHEFKGKHIGLPKIGAGLAGGDWERIKAIIQKELKDCTVTIVIYKP